MELDAEDREFAMGEAHNFALGSLGGNPEAVRKRVSLHQKGMIPRRLKGIRQVRKNIFAAVVDW